MKPIIAFDIGASKIAYAQVQFEIQNSKIPPASLRQPDSLTAVMAAGEALRAGKISSQKSKVENINFEIQNFSKIKTPISKKETIEKIIEIVKNFSGKKITAIGIGVAGQIDYKKGIVFSSPNMPGWKNVSLKKILEKELGLPVALSNDAHSFTIAEAKFGAAKGYHHIVGLTLGTGIGGGIIIDGKLYQGANNTAGEFGHTIVEAKYNFKCSCGFRKHLETFASGRAMENLYKKLSGKKLNTFKIEKRAIRGEKMALKVIIFSAKSLSIEMANIINFLNPEIIVIGGGLARINLLWKPMIQETKKKVFFPPLAKTKIVKSKLGDKAGVLGAALLATD